MDITKDLKTMGKLKREVEKAKVRSLSSLNHFHSSLRDLDAARVFEGLPVVSLVS